MAMTGLGACVAALVVATQGVKLIRESSLYAGIGFYSLFVFLCAQQSNPYTTGACLFLTGFGLILFFSCGNSLVQTRSPDHLRGRLMGIWALVFGGGMPFGSFWMGVVAQRTSSAVSMEVGGIFCLAAALGVYFFSRNSKDRGNTKEVSRVLPVVPPSGP